jgi:cellulose synthase/poly-beta-1,6-N-acetylglucosamine synthase-like glycosyltransferase
MRTIAFLLIAIPAALGLYAYVGYPILLRLLAAGRPAPPRFGDPPTWPYISILLPAYNEERSIRGTLEALLALDYPADRRQILVISDASTDRTDAIVQEFRSQGVELIRLRKRAGKTAAENVAARHLRGEVVVNTDATIRIPAASLKPLIRVFQDPTIGVASGRDISVGRADVETSRGEWAYVGYEMWIRRLETRAGSIVGASGCFYAIRRELVTDLFPEALSRDFASPLRAREAGYRTVSADEAICCVPRTVSIRSEFNRKVRTLARGLETLWYKRALMNPLAYGRFAWMLLSHKLCRWLVHLTLPLGLVGLVLLALVEPAALLVLAAVVLVAGVGILAWRWPEARPAPSPVSVCGFVVAVNVAALLAWSKALRGERNPIWEPTRRPQAARASGAAP